MSDPSRDSGDSPAVRLGRHLKRIRLAAGYTSQPALSARIGFVEDVIQKGETGKRVPSKEVFPAWIEACRTSIDGKRQILTDGEIQVLFDLWETARAGAGGVREFFEKYAAAEQKAAFLRFWGLLTVPGPLQTPEYAHAMFLAGGLDEDEATEQTELRMKRRSRVDGPNAAHVTGLIYEPVLHRLVGTPEIMTGQLDHLLKVSHRRNVIIQVVPDTGYFPGLEGAFHIASGPGIADTVDMVTVEDHVTDDPAVVGKVLARFEEIRGYALNVAESRTVITEALQRWNSQQQ
jgi:Domain of unknown function (DUF5753)